MGRLAAAVVIDKLTTTRQFLLGAVRDWAILADQKGPNCYDAMATRMSPGPTEF